MTASTMAPPSDLRAALDTLPADAMAAVEEISGRISREFFRLVPAEDLQQDFLLWLAEHPGHARQWHFIGDDAVLKFGWKSFRRDCARVMATSCRKEKARVFGYDPEDEVFYAKQQVQDLLKYVFESSVLAVDGSQQERTSTKNDPAKGGDKGAAIMDVRNAYKSVIYPGGKWDQVLEALYRHGATQSETARALGISQQMVSRHHERAITEILHALNGTLPFKVQHEGPGARKAVSNRVAQAITNKED